MLDTKRLAQGPAIRIFPVVLIGNGQIEKHMVPCSDSVPMRSKLKPPLQQRTFNHCCSWDLFWSGPGTLNNNLFQTSWSRTNRSQKRISAPGRPIVGPGRLKTEKVELDGGSELTKGRNISARLIPKTGQRPSSLPVAFPSLMASQFFGVWQWVGGVVEGLSSHDAVVDCYCNFSSDFLRWKWSLSA